MSPDYELDPTVLAETPQQLKLLADPLRTQILSLVLERAASVAELAEALDRPKSSTAYHVDQLVDAGFLRVVRTRKVRAVEERYYGRVGRTIVHGKTALPDETVPRNMLSEAAAEAAEFVQSGDPRASVNATLRHARIPRERADAFFERVNELAEEFTTFERDGDTVFGFVAAVYSTDQPTLPPKAEP